MDNTTKRQPDNNKLRISTIFRSSFSSCRDRSLSDAIIAPTANKPLPKPQSPKPPTHPFPSVCKPSKCPTFSQPVNNNNNPTTHVSKPDPARQKLSDSYSLFYSASSAPLQEKQSMNRTKKKCNKQRRSGRVVRKQKMSWLSSDDDEEESDALLGSRRRRAVKKRPMRKKTASAEDEEEIKAGEDAEMKDSYAVVKCSSDPYKDFRTSMVEMIVEKKMYKAEDLEKLLQRFLKLNSYRHHPIIIEAFMEIWDALFL